MIIKIFIWLLILAFFHALQEREIEGNAGWARHLPTFRINVFLTKFLIGKEITGYHIFMLFMWLIIFHGIFIFYPFTIKTELMILGLISYYWIIEDFLFFVVNPHYRFKNFKKGKISWHKRWFLGLPYTYWWGMIIGTTLLLLGR